MNSKYDVVVAGLGVHGSAAVRALALQGLRVLGLDARRPPHTEGSSHGRTRIIREAYFEHPLYVPLVQRSLALWRDLETEARRTLLCETGAIGIGPADGMVVAGALDSCRSHDIPHALIDAGEIRRRFPGLDPREDDIGVYEERAGALLAEECIESLAHVARSAGATLLFEEELLRWCAQPGAVTLATSRGTYEAAALVLALGPWIADGLADCPLPLAIERQTQHWFEAPPALRAGHCPVVLWEYERDRAFYVIPDLGHGVKAAVHHEGEITRSAAAVERTIFPRDRERARALLDRFTPGVGEVLNSAVCVYTNTPDHHFIVDRHPSHRNVILVSACSGHGFKFAPAIGEAAADLATTGARFPAVEPFRLDRFSA